jgi:hypothetical protein
MYLFPVTGVDPRIYLWQIRIFFFVSWVFLHEVMKNLMVVDRETRQPGGEFEITAGFVQGKDHERSRYIFHQPLTCWRITGSVCTKF